MARQRIVAQFMHEYERDVATNLIVDPTVSGKIVVGEVEEADIPKLQDAGLLVQEVGREESPPVNATRGLAPRAVLRGSEPRATAEDLGLDAPPTPAPVDVYVLQLRGPMLEQWRSGLTAAGADILERLQPDHYSARIALQQVPSVSNLSFVESVRLYSARETIDPSHLVTRGGPGAPAPQMVTFEALMHRPEDLDVVRSWLDEHGAAVVVAVGRKIRFFSLRSSPLVADLAKRPEVRWVDEYVPPRLSNDRARRLLGIDPAENGGAGEEPVTPTIPLTGDGELVAVADTGLDDQHLDFKGRIQGLVARGRPGDTTDPHGHGTHVAGSVLGDGAASQGAIRGTAPEAHLFFQSILDAGGGLGGLDPELAAVFDEAYQAGARIHSNSWGAAARSAYRVNSIEVDDFVASHPDMLIVIAAGNEGSAANPLNSPPGFVDLMSLDAPATAKNALTVGANRSDRALNPSPTWGDWWPVDFPIIPISAEEVTGNAQSMAAFSGRGPCDEIIRIKPDVVAPGTFIQSTRSQLAPAKNFWPPLPANTGYAYMGGTSMATPLVAGCAALVREYFVKHEHHVPSAALLKATLINGGRWLSGSDAIANYGQEPNFHQGFGAVYMPWSIPNVSEPNISLLFDDDWQTDGHALTFPGDAYQFVFNGTGTPWLRLCLVWTDPPGRQLQNNVTLTLEHSPSRKKWAGNQNRQAQLKGPDLGNNVQVIRIESPDQGPYVAQVTANNILWPPQRFALVITGGVSPPLSAMHAT